MKVLLLPSATGGHLQGVKEGLRRNGVESTVLYASEDKFAFGCDKSVPLHGLALRKRLRVVQSYADHDVIHFSDAKSVFPLAADAFVARLMGKRVFVTFNGTASRPKVRSYFRQDYSQWGRKRSFGYSLKDLAWDALKYTRNYAWVLAAERIFCLNPDLRIGLPKTEFLPYMKANVAQSTAPRAEFRPGQPLVIAHAPTLRAIKGTDLFMKAVAEINEQGEKIKLVLIEKVGNREAIELMKSAHVLFDQLWVGWYGGVAVEAMSLGIPVITYLRETDLARIPQEMRADLPIVRADPDSIKDVLLQLVEGRIDLARESERAVGYVRKYHDLEKLGKRLLSYYSGDRK